MDYQTEVLQVKDLLGKAKDVLIVTHEMPSPDSMGSALALYLGLISLGKRVTIACPDLITVGLSSFVGVNKVISDLAVKKNFVISLDYVDGSIEKVSYNIEGDKFNLVIEPRAGFDTFSAEKVHYAYAGGSADLIFAIDTPSLAGLKKLYDGNKELFTGKPIVNVDRHPTNAQYGAVNVVDITTSATAEVVARLLSMLGVKLTVDIATNLLNAVYEATNNFTVGDISPGAFDVASVALKAGGKRFITSSVSEEQKPTFSYRNQSKPVEEPQAPQVVDTRVSDQRSAHDAFTTPPAQSVTPVNPSADLPQGSLGQSTASSGQAPSDWLKPKIFKSSNLM